MPKFFFKANDEVLSPRYFAHHQLERLPHAEALGDPSRLRDVLGDKEYWLDRERVDRD
jgi:hypothetical protein